MWNFRLHFHSVNTVFQEAGGRGRLVAIVDMRRRREGKLQVHHDLWAARLERSGPGITRRGHHKQCLVWASLEQLRAAQTAAATAWAAAHSASAHCRKSPLPSLLLLLPASWTGELLIAPPPPLPTCSITRSSRHTPGRHDFRVVLHWEMKVWDDAFFPPLFLEGVDKGIYW